MNKNEKYACKVKRYERDLATSKLSKSEKQTRIKQMIKNKEQIDKITFILLGLFILSVIFYMIFTKIMH